LFPKYSYKKWIFLPKNEQITTLKKQHKNLAFLIFYSNGKHAPFYNFIIFTVLLNYAKENSHLHHLAQVSSEKATNVKFVFVNKMLQGVLTIIFRIWSTNLWQLRRRP
jgi:spore germination protein YaaH